MEILLTFKALAFRFYDENSPPIVTFSHKFDDYNKEIRSQLLGGMTMGTVLNSFVSYAMTN